MKMNYNLAQSQLFYEIAPSYRVIVWRNRTFLLTLRQNINDAIVYVTPFGLYDNMYARKVTKQIMADDLFKKG